MKKILTALLVLAAAAAGAQSLISEPQLKALLDRDKTVVVLDVRTAEEFASGHLPMAKLLPFDTITAQTAAGFVAAKATPVVVYCRSGRRSALAALTLKNQGYTNVRDLGAVTNWKGKLVTGVPR